MYPEFDMYDPYFDMDMYRKEKPVEGIDKELPTFQEALQMIREAIMDEHEDDVFYNELIKQAPTKKERNIITDIRNDEKKHAQILKDIYYMFTGEKQIEKSQTNYTNGNAKLTYGKQLEKALFGELEAIKRYRRIMSAIHEQTAHSLLMSIMTDEIRHANKFNFLITTKNNNT